MNGQLNVTPITDKQPQPSCEFKVSVVLDGFPIEISGCGRADDLRALVARLKAIGATPPTASTPEPTKQSGIPTCPVHNSQMKPSQKPGAFFCPKKDESGAYCRHKA